MSAIWKIRQVGPSWFVIKRGKVDDLLTSSLNVALRKLSPTTQRKAASLVEEFLCFEMIEGEADDAFLTESFDDGCCRIEAFLETLGHEIADHDRADGSRYVRQGSAGSTTRTCVGMSALCRLFHHLKFSGARKAANPFKVLNYDTWSPSERADAAEMLHGRANPYFYRYRGHQFIVVGESKPAIRMEDPIGLAPKMLEAGKAAAWPNSIYDLVSTMGDDGPRWCDTSPLTAADWARGSEFGRKFKSPNKASKKKRVKTTVISEAGVARLQRSFNEDPNRPSMDELKRLFEARDWVALENIYLFPSQLGRPHSYHVFNNDYVRPAMEKAGVMIHSSEKSERPTAHRLRAGRIQQSAQKIYVGEKTEHQIKLEEGQLKSDVFIKSDSAFERYLGPWRTERAEIGKIDRFDERMRELGHPEPTQPRPSVTLSDRLRNSQ